MNLKKLYNRTRTNHSTMRQFSYERGEVKLDFSLRTDTKGQLKDFLELLKEAQIDIEEELKN